MNEGLGNSVAIDDAGCSMPGKLHSASMNRRLSDWLTARESGRPTRSSCGTTAVRFIPHTEAERAAFASRRNCTHDASHFPDRPTGRDPQEKPAPAYRFGRFKQVRPPGPSEPTISSVSTPNPKPNPQPQQARMRTRTESIAAAIQELRSERDSLDQVIQQLERMFPAADQPQPSSVPEPRTQSVRRTSPKSSAGGIAETVRGAVKAVAALIPEFTNADVLAQVRKQSPTAEVTTTKLGGAMISMRKANEIVLVRNDGQTPIWRVAA